MDYATMYNPFIKVRTNFKWCGRDQGDGVSGSTLSSVGGRGVGSNPTITPDQKENLLKV